MAMLGFNDDNEFSLTIVGFSLSILGFDWQLWGFDSDHGFSVVLLHPCTFDTFFHYRSIRIYTYVLLVFIAIMGFCF